MTKNEWRAMVKAETRRRLMAEADELLSKHNWLVTRKGEGNSVTVTWNGFPSCTVLYSKGHSVCN